MKTIHNAGSSGGEHIRANFGASGDMSTHFSGSGGTYDITVFALDENDGQSMIKVHVNGKVVGTINLDRDSDGSGTDHLKQSDFSEFTLEGIQINKGDKVSLWIDSDRGEAVRLDKVKFQEVEEVQFRECDDPNAVNIDFEGLAKGTVLSTQYDG